MKKNDVNEELERKRGKRERRIGARYMSLES